MQKDNMKHSNLIVLDIGGTLSKVCFVSDSTETTIPHDSRLTSNKIIR
jgi:hexokinase